MVAEPARDPLAGGGRAAHELFRFDGRPGLEGGTLADAEPVRGGVLVRAGGSYTSRPVRVGRPFREALVSWNAAPAGDAGFRFELRVRHAGAGAWSPWLGVGDWNLPADLPRTVEFEGGRIEVDFLSGERDFDRFQLRLAAVGGDVLLARVTVCTTGTALAPPAGPGARRSSAWGHVLDVPPRSQKTEDPALAPRICSPTSVAMVLAWHGVDRPTSEVAERLYDARHDIYGNWTRAVQGAFSFGVPGWLRRFASLAELERELLAGRPVVVSIRAAEGELRGAPYAATGGHLLVVVGFDERGDVVVNDPAAPDAAGVRRVYRRGDLERVWLGHGGVAYVFEAPSDSAIRGMSQT